MRRRRNTSGYDDITIGKAALTADLAHAAAIRPFGFELPQSRWTWS
jgi:hypothetical protein